MKKLSFEVISHASWGDNEISEVTLKCVKYYRFKGTVEISTIKILPVEIRFTPIVIGQPAHIIIEKINNLTGEWELIKDVNLFRFSSENEHYIEIEKVQADMIRIICDLEHSVTQSHGEWWATPTVVPFNILNNVEIYGEKLEEIREPIYNPPLQKLQIQPGKINNVKIDIRSHEIFYESKYFSVAFSLKRPIIKKISFDCTGKGDLATNLLCDDSVWLNDFYGKCNNVTGPKYINNLYNFNAQMFTGEVDVLEDYVLYKNIKITDEFSMDMKFTVMERGMKVSISKVCHCDYQAIESEDFSFVWDCKKSISGVQGLPNIDCSRTGVVKLPALLSSPGFGTMEITPILKDDLYIQVDTFRDNHRTWFSPILGGKRDEYGYINFQKGVYHCEFDFILGGMLPNIEGDFVPDALRKGWSAAFGFRPDFAGFSNNALSGNCHLSQYHIADLVPYTKKSTNGVNMTDLLKFTIELSLRGGPGYGDYKDLFLDSDPSILITVGRVYQLEKNKEWIIKWWSEIKQTVLRVLSNIDEYGLVKCEALTGNSGSKKWSCNGWDVISFGNYDAYSNLQAYRALKNSEIMANILGDKEVEQLCSNAHTSIKNRFEDTFKNPETGVISGWVSADGMHHDYLFTHINAMAICFGLLKCDTEKHIMTTLISKLNEMGLDYFYYGIPVNLISIRNEDAPNGNDYLREDGLDKYGTYINGSLSTVWMNYFIRALEICGFEDYANKICDDLLVSFEEKTLYGGFHSGTEFFTWQGQPCGYEGVLVGQFPVLVSLAIRKDLVTRLENEWWI